MRKYIEVCDDPDVEFRPMRSIRKISVDTDLTVSAVEGAMVQHRRGSGIQNGTLIVPEALAVTAGRIRAEFINLTDIGLSVIVLPDEMFSNLETWALMNEHHHIIWSPGA